MLRAPAELHLVDVPSSSGGHEVEVQWVDSPVREGWSVHAGVPMYGHREGVGITADRDTVRLSGRRTPPALVRLLIQGVGISMVGVSHGLPVLHGTSLLLDGRVVVVCGPSGVGKSTVSAALLAAGASLIADDVTMLDPEVRFGPGQIKLWGDGVAYFGLEAAERVHPDFDKYLVPVRSSTATGTPEVVLVVERGGATARLRGHDAVMALLANHRLPEVLPADGSWLRAVGALAATVPVWRLGAPEGLGAVVREVDRWLARYACP